MDWAGKSMILTDRIAGEFCKVNVCNDQIIEAAKNEYVKNRADLERDFIKEIDAAEVNSEIKCRAIFALMDGKPIDEIRENFFGMNVS